MPKGGSCGSSRFFLLTFWIVEQDCTHVVERPKLLVVLFTPAQAIEAEDKGIFILMDDPHKSREVALLFPLDLPFLRRRLRPLLGFISVFVVTASGGNITSIAIFRRVVAILGGELSCWEECW